MVSNLPVYCFLSVAILLFSRNAKASDDKVARVYELKRGNMSFKFTNLGASMVSAIVPDKYGNLTDIVLGYPSVDSYKTYSKNTTYFGNIVGRVANRISNARFRIKGKFYKLVPNDGQNTLHGGSKGFGQVLWKVRSYNKLSHVSFTYTSYDGEEGFPGAVNLSVTYILKRKNMLQVRMIAIPTTKETPINLALHTYWNLAGHNSGTILNHTVQIFGSGITVVDNEKNLIPTGDIAPVDGSPYDFLQPHQIRSRINALPDGYDINYVVKDGSSHRHLHKVAVVKESVSGRKLELWTNQPGLQFYTGNMLNNVAGKDGCVYSKHSGFTLETQGFPDAVNHPEFPSQIVCPGKIYRHHMLFRFAA